jgi:hypothetical protein
MQGRDDHHLICYLDPLLRSIFSLRLEPGVSKKKMVSYQTIKCPPVGNWAKVIPDPQKGVQIQNSLRFMGVSSFCKMTGCFNSC